MTTSMGSTPAHSQPFTSARTQVTQQMLFSRRSGGAAAHVSGLGKREKVPLHSGLLPLLLMLLENHDSAPKAQKVKLNLLAAALAKLEAQGRKHATGFAVHAAEVAAPPTQEASSSSQAWAAPAVLGFRPALQMVSVSAETPASMYRPLQRSSKSKSMAWTRCQWLRTSLCCEACAANA